VQFKLSFVVNDAKYAGRRQKMLGANYEQGKGGVSIIEMEKKKEEKIIVTDKKILSMEISKDEKVIFVNLYPQ
jgi:hypothetical protein